MMYVPQIPWLLPFSLSHSRSPPALAESRNINTVIAKLVRKILLVSNQQCDIYSTHTGEKA